jgi:hypothetical protein
VIGLISLRFSAGIVPLAFARVKPVGAGVEWSLSPYSDENPHIMN